MFLLPKHKIMLDLFGLFDYTWSKKGREHMMTTFTKITDKEHGDAWRVNSDIRSGAHLQYLHRNAPIGWIQDIREMADYPYLVQIDLTDFKESPDSILYGAFPTLAAAKAEVKNTLIRFKSGS